MYVGVGVDVGAVVGVDVAVVVAEVNDMVVSRLWKVVSDCEC